MAEQGKNELTLRELAERSGVPARTIRLYIARELLPGPLRAGRNAAYGAEHLDRLADIRRMQGEGLTLREIAHRLGLVPADMGLPEPSAWLRYEIADDVIAWVRADVSPWRSRQARAALGRLSQELSNRKETNHDNGS